MSIRTYYEEDLENLILCILEDGTDVEEVKGIVDRCVGIKEQAEKDRCSA